MNKIVSIIIFVGGIILFGYGIQSWSSVGSDFSRLFTGAAVDKAVWLLIAGGIAVLIGAAGFLRRRRIL